MTEHRNWRDAKIPQWVKDSIIAESAALELRAALSWPTETRPTPLPFQWGDYDRLIGEVVPGEYWRVSQGVGWVHIARTDTLTPEERLRCTHWQRWAFKRSGSVGWTNNVPRGPLFATKREADLYALWLECEASAHKLMNMKRKLSEVKE